MSSSQSGYNLRKRGRDEGDTGIGNGDDRNQPEQEIAKSLANSLRKVSTYKISEDSLTSEEIISEHDALQIRKWEDLLNAGDEANVRGEPATAARIYHEATVGLHGLVTTHPHLASHIGHLITSTACLAQQCSSVIANLVRENFTGKDQFSESYEKFGEVLGEGGHGEVKRCSRRPLTQNPTATAAAAADDDTGISGGSTGAGSATAGASLQAGGGAATASATAESATTASGEGRGRGGVFACKTLKNQSDPKKLRQLHMEIWIMKQLHHPNIVQLKEVFYEYPEVHLVMEYCGGGDLFSRAVDKKSTADLTEERVAKMMLEMMSAVHYLHQRNIFHCDLKLDNFVFESAEIDSPLKLIDFGLARRYDSTAFLNTVGTCYYMAPEIQNHQYDHRCDIWSLGVIAYILLSGTPPVAGGKSGIEIMAKLKNSENLTIDFTEKVFPHASAEAVDFLQRLLKKSPSERITLEEAFQHPFIRPAHNTQQLAARTASPSSDIVKSLTRFMRLSNYKKFMLKVVAFSLDRQKIAQLGSIFNDIDTDHSGTISLGELRQYITRTISADCSAQTERQLRLAAESIESHDENATLDYNEFLAAAMCSRISIKEDELVEAFRSLDTDNKGYLNRDVIRRHAWTDMTTEEVEEMIAAVDVNHTGKINLTDFISQWKSFMEQHSVTPLQKLQKVAHKVRSAVGFLRRMSSGAGASTSTPAGTSTPSVSGGSAGAGNISEEHGDGTRIGDEDGSDYDDGNRKGKSSRKK